jgi:hypothetical protein
VIFLEMVLKLNLGYFYRGYFEKDRIKIMRNYLKSNFLVDFMGRGAIFLKVVLLD